MREEVKLLEKHNLDLQRKEQQKVSLELVQATELHTCLERELASKKCKSRRWTENRNIFVFAGLKIYFTGPSDKMSDDVEFGSDICPMTFSSVLTWK